MAKTHKRLRDRICSYGNLYLAYNKVAKANPDCPDYTLFKENLGTNIYDLRKELLRETYKRGDHIFFIVHDRKKRLAANLPFRDKVVQHAINNVIEPIFDGIFYSCSYACRKNKGTHKGVIYTQAAMRRLKKEHGEFHCLKTDFHQFFPSVNIKILMREIKRKISCKWLLRLLWQLFQNIKTGLIIGDLISQLASNIYGHILDRFAKTKLKIRYYIRYADDVVVLHHCKRYLRSIKRKIKKFSALFMGLSFSKWGIIKAPLHAVNFLGYRIKTTYRLLRKESILNARKKIKRYIKKLQFFRLSRFLAAWLGHASWASSFNLIKNMEKRYAFTFS